VAVAAVALAILPHAHEHPAALQLLAREHEFEVPLPKRTFRIATVLWRPEAAIPKHDGATPVFTLGDCALEVAVVERVVLDLHGQAPVTGVEGWPFRHRPGLEDPVHLQAQIVMQPGSRMLLDDKTRVFRRLDVRRTAWLSGFREVALSLIEGEVAGCHRSHCKVACRKQPAGGKAVPTA